jgi:heterotetrameric sarcosine oxidase gamma subunit
MKWALKSGSADCPRPAQGAPPSRLLAKLCPLDLDPVVFGPDAVALTKFSQVAVQLWRAGNADSFDVVFPRSYSRYLWRALLEASAE